MGLEVKNIVKHFGDKTVLDGVSFSLEEGHILCFLGPSGCGKTTLLRIIAGLENSDGGDVFFRGRSISGVASHRRNFGMMFQDYALFPHKSVLDNVLFGLEMKKLSPGDARSRAGEMLELVGLSGFENRPVTGLSGGEKQRVALARSLAPQPEVLMLDEPLGSLDRALRERLMIDLREILKKVGVTAVFVTHDQAEAFAVADEIAVFSTGKIEQMDRSEVVYRQPLNRTVAAFLGFRNILKGTLVAEGLVQTETASFKGVFSASGSQGESVEILIRPEGARIVSPCQGVNKITGKIESRIFQGKSYSVGVRAEGEELLYFDLPWEQPFPEIGDEICLDISSLAVVLL